LQQCEGNIRSGNIIAMYLDKHMAQHFKVFGPTNQKFPSTLHPTTTFLVKPYTIFGTHYMRGAVVLFRVFYPLCLHTVCDISMSSILLAL
jgi:hypothetical protein